MFQYSTSETAEVNIDKVWAHYKSVNLWHLWDTSVEEATLQGNFKKGSAGEMKNVGMPVISFELTEVTEYESFSNISRLGPFTVLFDHHIAVNGAEVTVEHSVTVDGPNEQKVNEIGQNIAATIPSAIRNLLDLTK